MDQIEKKTIDKMIHIYCQGTHHTVGFTALCESCRALNEYAHKRLDRCPYGTNKPSCKRCKTHCYAPHMRDEIKRVMRFSGPRMLYRSPLLALVHLYKQITVR